MPRWRQREANSVARANVAGERAMSEQYSWAAGWSTGKQTIQGNFKPRRSEVFMAAAQTAAQMGIHRD
jgi:hypothetical protein